MMKGGVLSGLRGNPNVAAFAKGRRMQGAAGLRLDNAQAQQRSGIEQMQQDSSQRQQRASNYAARAGNEAQERTQAAGLQSRANVFDTSMKYDYAALNKRRRLNTQQALLNGLSRSL